MTVILPETGTHPNKYIVARILYGMLFIACHVTSVLHLQSITNETAIIASYVYLAILYMFTPTFIIILLVGNILVASILTVFIGMNMAICSLFIGTNDQVPNFIVPMAIISLLYFVAICFDIYHSVISPNSVDEEDI